MRNFTGGRREKVNLAKEHFIVALEDPELELKIREREPRTLDSALRVAQRFEVFRNAVRSRKQKMSRQVILSDEEVQVAKVEQVANKNRESKSDKTESQVSDKSDRSKKSSDKFIARKVKKEKYGVNSAVCTARHPRPRQARSMHCGVVWWRGTQ